MNPRDHVPDMPDSVMQTIKQQIQVFPAESRPLAQRALVSKFYAEQLSYIHAAHSAEVFGDSSALSIEELDARFYAMPFWKQQQLLLDLSMADTAAKHYAEAIDALTSFMDEQSKEKP
jgi:hypothetical protein